MIDEAAVTNRKVAKGQVERVVCDRLRALAAAVPADQAIVELGAYRGRSTGWLLLGAQDGNGAHVTTIDPWGMRKDGYATDHPAYSSQDTYALFKGHMERIGATKDAHTVKRAYGANVGRRWDGPPVGLLFHDAEHTADAVAEDLTAWAPHVAVGGAVVLHDTSNPAFGVLEGVKRALPADAWDKVGPEILTWPKHPTRRGAIVIRKTAQA
jgi:hypothetical protein